MPVLRVISDGGCLEFHSIFYDRSLMEELPPFFLSDISLRLFQSNMHIDKCNNNDTCSSFFFIFALTMT